MKLPTLTETTKPEKQSTVSEVTDMGDAEYAMDTQIYIVDTKE